jgi:DNA (cytosine-5)-methyltransferase 1
MRAGWKGLFAVEKDAFAFETLNANFSPGSSLDYAWPTAIERRPWDVHDLLAKRRPALEELAGSVDLLAGGPPCQGFSHAGKRHAHDPRNRLFEDYLELVAILKPHLVLVENVRGFGVNFAVSELNDIENFSLALKSRLEGKYEVSSATIRASDFGVPQVRPRFFLVGRRRDLPSAAHLEVSGFFDELSRSSPGFLAKRDLPRRPSARDAISDLEVGRNGTIPSPDSEGFDAIAYGEPRTAFQRVMRDGHDAAPSDTRLARHRPEIQERFEAIIRAAREDGRLTTTISPELRHKHGLRKMAIRVMDPLGVAPTITSMPDDLLHYSEPRTLTVRENARLQTFPDWFVFRGKYTTGGDRRRREVPRFTQVANAVPPLLAEQLGLCLRQLLHGSVSSMCEQSAAQTWVNATR